jgi:hypothetical protein
LAKLPAQAEDTPNPVMDCCGLDSLIVMSDACAVPPPHTAPVLLLELPLEDALPFEAALLLDPAPMLEPALLLEPTLPLEPAAEAELVPEKAPELEAEPDPVVEELEPVLASLLPASVPPSDDDPHATKVTMNAGRPSFVMRIVMYP